MRAWLIDTLERAGFTFVESFIGLLVVDASGAMGDSIDLATLEAAAVSAFIAALAVVKAAIASRRDALSPASMVGDLGE